jgi:hypothetical protein
MNLRVKIVHGEFFEPLVRKGKSFTTLIGAFDSRLHLIQLDQMARLFLLSRSSGFVASGQLLRTFFVSCSCLALTQGA